MKKTLNQNFIREHCNWPDLEIFEVFMILKVLFLADFASQSKSRIIKPESRSPTNS